MHLPNEYKSLLARDQRSALACEHKILSRVTAKQQLKVRTERQKELTFIML